MLIDAIVTDLDDTLLNENSQLSPFTLDVLHQAVRKGIRLIPASGRAASSMFPFTRQLATLIDAGLPIIRSLGILQEQVESAVFKDGNKWRFSDGASSFFAEITDADFLARIESGDERFGKGDVLIVDLRRIQSVTDNGLKLAFVIERVREHKAPLQAGLLPR